VRAITDRFCTDDGGVDTCGFIFEAPSELCAVGLTPTEFVTFAPFREASVTWNAPRFIICP
jgi:hypothetical protein